MQLPQTLVPHTHRLQFPAERDSWIEGIPAGRNQYMLRLRGMQHKPWNRD